MLVFSRKAGEEVVLPKHGVTIGVVAIGGQRVRLGISAPFDIPVHRQEIQEQDEEDPVEGAESAHDSSE